jgi:hypothetical protein
LVEDLKVEFMRPYLTPYQRELANIKLKGYGVILKQNIDNQPFSLWVVDEEIICLMFSNYAEILNL